jgi:hypothetical protein
MYSGQTSWSALLPTIDTRISGTGERLQFWERILPFFDRLQKFQIAKKNPTPKVADPPKRENKPPVRTIKLKCSQAITVVIASFFCGESPPAKPVAYWERLKGADKTVSRPRRQHYLPPPLLKWGIKALPSQEQPEHDCSKGLTFTSPPATPGFYFKKVTTNSPFARAKNSQPA